VIEPRHNRIAPLTKEGLQDLFTRLRARDIEECNEYGIAPHFHAEMLVANAVCGDIFTWKHRPAAFVAFHALTPRSLAVSMFASDDWPHVARRMIKWAVVAKAGLLSRGYTRAECRTMDKHDDAIRMLEHLGFQLECRLPGYGASGRDFHQYAWTLQE
jgi:hypothetical protein